MLTSLSSREKKIMVSVIGVVVQVQVSNITTFFGFNVCFLQFLKPIESGSHNSLCLEQEVLRNFYFEICY